MNKSRKLIELKEKNYSKVKKKKKEKQNFTINEIHKTPSNISKIVNRNWNILQINTEFHGVSQATPMIAFKRSKNLQEIIGGHTVRQGNVFKKSLARLKGKSMPSSSTRSSVCCTQIVNTQMFTSEQTKRTFNIFRKLTCKSI